MLLLLEFNRNMRIIQRLALFFFLVGAIISNRAFCQEIVIQLTNGGMVTHQLNLIRSVTFPSQSMRLNFVNGTSSTWNLSDIAQFRYNQAIVTETGEFQNQNPFEFNLYPNPASSSAVNLEFELIESGQVQILIRDFIGRQVSFSESFYSIGKHHLRLNLIDSEKMLTNGPYVCTLVTEKKTSSLPIFIIKQ